MKYILSFLVTILCQSFKLPVWLAPLAKLYCISCYDLPLPSSLVIRSSLFLSFSITTFPLLKVASDSWVCVKEDIFTTLPSTFPSPHYPSPWERDGVRILFLSPRNPVFTIFGIAVLCYHSTTYIPFLYQSSKIRISFL